MKAPSERGLRSFRAWADNELPFMRDKADVPNYTDDFVALGYGQKDTWLDAVVGRILDHYVQIHLFKVFARADSSPSFHVTFEINYPNLLEAPTTYDFYSTETISFEVQRWK